MTSEHTKGRLKACPFCGEDSATHTMVRDGRQVFCRKCHASAGPRHHGPNHDTLKRAIAAWNMRDEEPCDTCGAASHNLRANKAEGRADAAEALLAEARRACGDVSIMLGTALQFYADEPWAKRILAVMAKIDARTALAVVLIAIERMP